MKEKKEKKEYLYFVQGVQNDSQFVSIGTAKQIFEMMADADDISLELYRVNGFGEDLTECSFIRKDGMMHIVGGGIRESSSASQKNRR